MEAKAEFLFDSQLLLEPRDFFELLVRSSRTDCLITGNIVKALCCLCEGEKRSNDKKMQTDRLTDRDEWMLCVSLVK